MQKKVVTLVCIVGHLAAWKEKKERNTSAIEKASFLLSRNGFPLRAFQSASNICQQNATN